MPESVFTLIMTDSICKLMNCKLMNIFIDQCQILFLPSRIPKISSTEFCLHTYAYPISVASGHGFIFTHFHNKQSQILFINSRGSKFNSIAF